MNTEINTDKLAKLIGTVGLLAAIIVVGTVLYAYQTAEGSVTQSQESLINYLSIAGIALGIIGFAASKAQVSRFISAGAVILVVLAWIMPLFLYGI